MAIGTLEVRPGEVPAPELEALDRSLAPRDSLTAKLVGPLGEQIELPNELFGLLRTAVEELKKGNGVAVVPLHARLTTVEAAELLNVSRPYLIKLLEAKELPYQRVGTHRRVMLADALAYRDRLKEEADQALTEMTREGEELGLYK
jgi:excisionase family DNA binding protein